MGKDVNVEEVLANLSGETLVEEESGETINGVPSVKAKDRKVVMDIEPTIPVAIKPSQSKLTQEKFTEYLNKGFIDKDGNPGINNVRFTEIYEKMSGFERQLGEKDETIKLIQDHNQKLSDSIDSVTDKIDNEKAPDFATDPQGYAEFLENRVTKVVERALKKVTPTTPVTPVTPTNSGYTLEEEAAIRTQIAIQEGLHKDYKTMIGITKGDMDRDPVLRATIAASSNPSEAAYEHGKKRFDDGQANTNANSNAAYVEPGAYSSGLDEGGTIIDELTPNQKRTADALGVSHTKYLRQMNQINEKRKVAI